MLQMGHRRLRPCGCAIRLATIIHRRGEQVMKFAATLALCAALSVSSAAPAQSKRQRAPLVEALANCRGERDDAARLRCYDTAAAALTDATAQGKLVVIDQEDVRKTRRSLFGFSVPKLPFFSGDDSAGEQQSEITAKLDRVSALPHGKWQLRLEDGALWETTEVSAFTRPPRAGNEVVIKRGALGNYFLRINGQRGIRGRRFA